MKIFDSWCRTIRSSKEGSPKGGPFLFWPRDVIQMANSPRLAHGIVHSAMAFSKAFRRHPPDDFAFGLFSIFPRGCCK